MFTQYFVIIVQWSRSRSGSIMHYARVQGKNNYGTFHFVSTFKIYFKKNHICFSWTVASTQDYLAWTPYHLSILSKPTKLIYYSFHSKYPDICIYSSKLLIFLRQFPFGPLWRPSMVFAENQF